MHIIKLEDTVFCTNYGHYNKDELWSNITVNLCNTSRALEREKEEQIYKAHIPLKGECHQEQCIEKAFRLVFPFPEKMVAPYHSTSFIAWAHQTDDQHKHMLHGNIMETEMK